MEPVRRFLFHIVRGLVWLLEPCVSPFWIRGASGTGELTRVAVLLDSGVGDTLMATPMLRELRRQLPQAAVMAVVDRATVQVLSRNPDVDALCVFREAGDDGRVHWGALRRVRSFRPQAMVVPQTGNTLKQIFATYYSGAAIRVKHRFAYPPSRRYSDYEFLFTHSPEVCPGRHRVWDNLGLLEPLGLVQPMAPEPMACPISAWARERARELLLGRNWQSSLPSVCMHPGVGTATLKKQWPSERFAELGRRLVAQHGLQIVLVGGRGEVELCRRIASSIGSACVVVAGECSLAETGAVIGLCRLFVSNDSGLMHLAAALGARGVSVFGKTDPVKIGPFGGTFRIVQGADIEELSADEVCKRCAELLERPAVEERA